MGKINKSISDIIKQDFAKFDDLYAKLSEIFFINNKDFNKRILISVSGWPDSMFLSIIIYTFFVKNNLDLNNLFFVHCNHKTRRETDSEQAFIEDFFKWLNLFISVYTDKKNSVNFYKQPKTEQNLRLWRYYEFQKVIDKNNIDFLLTWHNLTDRIESSFMNMFRGAWLNWFTSMKFEDNNNLLSVDIVRPLLWYTKSEIENFCKEYGVEFMIDKTNLDKNTSLRNNIRLSLFPQFADLSNKSDDDTNTFFDSMKQIYKELDEIELNKQINVWNLIEIPQSPYWNSQFAFLRDIPLWFISKNILLQIFQKFNISNNVGYDSLDDYLEFFHNAKQWYIYYKSKTRLLEKEYWKDNINW